MVLIYLQKQSSGLVQKLVTRMTEGNSFDFNIAKLKDKPEQLHEYLVDFSVCTLSTIVLCYSFSNYLLSEKDKTLKLLLVIIVYLFLRPRILQLTYLLCLLLIISILSSVFILFDFASNLIFHFFNSLVQSQQESNRIPLK